MTALHYDDEAADKQTHLRLKRLKGSYKKNYKAERKKSSHPVKWFICCRSTDRFFHIFHQLRQLPHTHTHTHTHINRQWQTSILSWSWRNFYAPQMDLSGSAFSDKGYKNTTM